MKKLLSLLLALSLLAAPAMARDYYSDELTQAEKNDAARVRANCIFLQTAEKNLAENPGDIHAMRVRDTVLEDNAKLLEKNSWTVEGGVIYDSSRRTVAYSDSAQNGGTSSSSQEKQPAIAPPTSADRYDSGSRYYSSRYDDRYYGDWYYDDWYYDNRYSYYDDYYYGSSTRRVAVSYSRVALSRGENMRLSAMLLPTYASDRTLTWWSTDTSVATVDAYGLVHAVSAGTATIYIDAPDAIGAYCTVTVY